MAVLNCRGSMQVISSGHNKMTMKPDSPRERNSTMISRLIQISTVLLALIASHAVEALIIEVILVEEDLVRVVLSEIDAVDDRVYTIRLDEDGGAFVEFGDGIEGARLPTGTSNVVASYRHGGGTDGNIVNEYMLTEIELPFIPISDFLDEGSGQLDASFVIVGISSLTLEFSGDGLRVVDAEITQVPEPGTLALIAIGLAGMGLARRRKKI